MQVKEEKNLNEISDSCTHNRIDISRNTRTNIILRTERL